MGRQSQISIRSEIGKHAGEPAADAAAAATAPPARPASAEAPGRPGVAHDPLAHRSATHYQVTMHALQHVVSTCIRTHQS